MMTNKKVDFGVCKDFRESIKEDLIDLKQNMKYGFENIKNNDFYHANMRFDKIEKAIKDNSDKLENLNNKFLTFSTKTTVIIGILGSIGSLIGTIIIQLILKWISG